MKCHRMTALAGTALVVCLCAAGVRAQNATIVGANRSWGLVDRTATPTISPRPGGPQRGGGSRGRYRPEVEVYFGIAYANLDIAGFAERRHSVGWGASVTGYFNRYFGITGDFAGEYNPKCPENDLQCFVELLRATEIRDYSAYQFLVGPQLRTPGNRFRGFVHALFGGARSHARLLTVATGVVREFNSGPDFAMAFGGGVDWNLGDRIAVRLLQVDYIPARESASAWRHNVRFQGGVLFRFGGTK